MATKSSPTTMANNPRPSSSLPMEDLEKVFNKFDANGDGKISSSELQSLLTALDVPGTSTEEVAAMMKVMDSDGDGYIDLSEYVDFHAQSPLSEEKESNKELREAFDLYDKDKNGLISPRELHDVMKRLGEKCSLKDCSRMIRSVDVDGDGHVNFEEFKKMMAG